MAASTGLTSGSAGGLPPPPGFRAEMGFEDEGYERLVSDAPDSSVLNGAILPTTLRAELVSGQAPAAVSMPRPFAAGSTVGVALAAYGFRRLFVLRC